MKKVVSMVALCAGMLFAACGGDGDTKTVTATTATQTTQTTTPTRTQERGKPKPRISEKARNLNRRTRAYVNASRRCTTVLAVAMGMIRTSPENIVQVAEAVAVARQACQRAEDELIGMETDDFDDESTLLWDGVRTIRSGLGATQVYIDTQAPTKLVEARDKLSVGAARVREGRREMNRRRRELGLKPLRIRD